MRQTCIKTAALAGLLSTASVMFAMPPIPGIITAHQPDGSTIEVELRGDEHFSWAVTPDGTTLMRDADGFLRPVSLQELTAARKSRPAKAPATQVDNSFPTRGKWRLLMLLVNFSDTETTYSQQDFNDYMNKKGYLGIGSFRDYYLENSYSALDIETTVTPWITVSGRKIDYNTDNSPNLIYEALEKAAQTIDLTQFDNDGDGILDGLAVIHQGPGQESTLDPTDIWSHSDMVRGRVVGGVEVRRYTIQPEVLRDGISTIGVMCHEFGHNLGAPDFYDTDYSGSGGEFPGTGVWDLMGSGAWNGVYGNRPAGVNMWQKIQYGWVTPQLLDSDLDVTDMPGSTFSPAAYRMNTTVPNDYFIIENRQREGSFDSALPGSGLLIYHANDNLVAANVQSNTINSAYPQALYTVCAAANSDPTTNPDSYGNAAYAPFPGASGKYTSFNDESLPSSRSVSGRRSYCGLSDISINSDGTASFSFRKEEAPASPQNLSATAAKGIVTLTWEMPAGSDWTHFNIYRNGVLTGESQSTGYVDESPASGRLVYEVDAEYASGLISPCSSVTLRVPDNKIESVNYDVSESGVTLNWALSTKLTRKDDSAGDSYQIVEHEGTTVEFAHRFTADDLIVYKGDKIRRVCFMAYQSSADAEYTIRVWKGSKGSNNPTLVSERLVKEFGASIWNHILLTSSVTITPDNDYWIGVKIKTKNGVAQMLADNGDLVPGLGNLVRINEGEWQADNRATGNYYLECELSPATDDAMTPVATFDTFNPETDLYYPVGFVISRDGQTIGTSSSRYFHDPAPLAGTHTYAITSLYKGGSESLPTEVSIATSAIEAVSEDSAISVLHTSAGIIVEGGNGPVSVYDAAGRTIFLSAAYDGREIPLSPGIYVVKAGTSAFRICVR